MRKLFTDKALTIAAGRAVSGIAERRQTLQIVSGRVWITVEGVSHDYWLSAGEEFVVTPGCLVVIEADKVASSVQVRAASAPHTVLSLSSRLSATVRRALRGSFTASLLATPRHQQKVQGCSSCPGR